MTDYNIIAEKLGEQLEKDDYHDDEYGKYHPSHISGCPLGATLDFMLESETDMNQYLFNGTAVHYYLQESGLLTSALHEAGFHALNTEYEVEKYHKLGENHGIIGRCDVLTGKDDKKLVIDIKYTSLKPEYNNKRMIKYATQVNTYANMFDADEWCLLLVYSRADHVPDEISTISGERDEENWNIVKEKANCIHDCLTHFNYHKGNRWSEEELKGKDDDFWEEVMQFFDEEEVPSYEGELKYSDRDEWVPPYKDDWNSSGGLLSFSGGV